MLISVAFENKNGLSQMRRSVLSRARKGRRSPFEIGKTVQPAISRTYLLSEAELIGRCGFVFLSGREDGTCKTFDVDAVGKILGL